MQTSDKVVKKFKSKELRHIKKIERNKKIDTNIFQNTNNKNTTNKISKINITLTFTNKNEENMETEDIKFVESNPDLTFLDDFDVDALVESLFSCENSKKMILDNRINNSVENGNKSAELTTLSESESLNGNSNISKNIKISKEFTRINNNKDNSSFCSSDNIVTLDNIVSNTKNKDVHETEFVHIEKPSVIAIQDTKENNPESKNLKEKIFSYELNDLKKPSEIYSKDENVYQEQNEVTLHNPKEFKDNGLDKNTSMMENGTNFVEEHLEIKQEILKYHFVTKFDKILAGQLEIKMCDTLKNKFSVISVSHYGQYSKIFKCTNSSEQHYAVKILDKHDHYSNEENMLKILKKDIPLENLSCILLLNSFDLQGQKCLMTHYYPSNLEQYLQSKKMPIHIDQIRNLAKQLVEAVFALRIYQIIHSDIKPSHILLDSINGQLKVCGFDEAYYYYLYSNTKSSTGTTNYRAPENILGYSYGYSIDVWSTALVIYNMTTNSTLFSGKTDYDVLLQQMCLFGNLPEEMIKGSKFKNTCFIGGTPTALADNHMNNCIKGGNIKTYILAAQSVIQSGLECNEQNYTFKVQLLCTLIEKMLKLHPKQRLTIEYVCANTFFSSY